MLPKEPANIKVGDRICRQVNFFTNRPPEVPDLVTTPSEKGGAIVRAEPGERYDCKDPWVAVANDRQRGLVCFCRSSLNPGDHVLEIIGFEVTRVNNGGTSVCVTPIEGTREMLLRHYES
ncbi:MAG: hypothetical protein WC693_02365 [Patescibacteria group bacterium]|jgi:hypothetical protein